MFYLINRNGHDEVKQIKIYTHSTTKKKTVYSVLVCVILANINKQSVWTLVWVFVHNLRYFFSLWKDRYFSYFWGLAIWLVCHSVSSDRSDLISYIIQTKTFFYLIRSNLLIMLCFLHFGYMPHLSSIHHYIFYVRKCNKLRAISDEWWCVCV